MSERVGVSLNRSLAPIPQTTWQRVTRFWSSPARVKFFLIARRFRRWFPNLPTAVQLSFGSWWLAQNSALDRILADGGFEPAETQFLVRFLRPGMTVLDVGAHHGYFTLLMSKAVGSDGKVIAFEPSPRERVRLERHIHFNGCVNTQIEPVALGASSGEADFFLVHGAEDYCNSLRPPAVEAGTTKVRVTVATLDGVLSRKAISKVDFIKLDAEGAELEVLQGAMQLLTTIPRPVLLVEVYDTRTTPWGYAAREIVCLLNGTGYRWYRLFEGGIVEPIDAGLRSYDMNLIAVPEERVGRLQTGSEA